ncbi:unnamed protein product [Pieris macdunnoughi]|uniref:Odorant receptor n=1 Tax=Pieris macdunnoughi TaxID=345717 RepID=A0A821PZM8_9NEOP|nr:unnamed protein product [Pieris macdunnoughi]
MKRFENLWQKLTHTKALELSSGRFETLYFESAYRVTYLAGLSFFHEKPLYSIYSTTVKLFLFLLCVSELWYFLTSQWTIDTIIDSVNITIIQLSAFYKYTKKLANESVFRRLASSMNSEHFDLSTEERKKIFEMWQRRNEGHVKLILGLGTCTIIAWYIYPLVDDLDFNLSVPIRLPFNYQTPILYPITYIGVIIVFSYISYFVMVNDLIIQVHLMHLLCQYSILSDCFRHILRDCKQDFKGMDETQLYSNLNFRQKYKNRLGSLTQQHKFILNNTSDLRDILSAPMLAQLAVSTTLICSIGYQLVATSMNVNITKWLMSLLYLGYNMFGLYILCRWCEEVKIQSIAVGEAVYFSGWERGITQVPGVRSSILLILARCNKPLVLSAGGMYDLSLQAYATMVKTSYSALTVLLRFRQS